MKKFKKILPYAIALCVLAVLFVVIKIPCPIKYITGVSCAGCGMTRAYISLFKLDIKSAFEFHPLWWLVPVAIALYLVTGRLNKKRLRAVLVAVIAAVFLAVYAVRLLDGDCEVVSFDLTESIFYRAYLGLKNLF
ncbi:MAG: DUF2752 domain-containing protein [Clostridia bacterium]|nr:DUF2752 domain-containing protein [Clostridia bacterium]